MKGSFFVLLPLFAFVLLPLLALFCWAIGRWIMAPIRKSAINPRPTFKFSLTDLFILLAQLGVAGLLVFNTERPAREIQARTLGMVSLWFVIGIFWALCVRWLSHAGIQDSKKRSTVLALGMPLAFFIFPLAMLSPLSVVRHVGRSVSSAGGVQTILTEDYFWIYGLRLYVSAGLEESIGYIVGGGFLVAALGSFLVARRIARWAVRK